MEPLPENYQCLSGIEKQRLLWANIEATKYTNDMLPDKSLSRYFWDAVASGFFWSKEYSRKTYLHVSDETPDGRKKIFHCFGTACQVELKPTDDHPYTGIFQSGACGILRTGLIFKLKSCTPGMGFKFLVDGQPSVNIPTFPSISGQLDDNNFFKMASSNTMANDFNTILLKTMRWAVNRAVKSLKVNGLKFDRQPMGCLAETRRDGTRIEQSRAPFEVLFAPTPEVQISSAAEPDYRIKMADVPSGSFIYNLLAKENADAIPKKIGEIHSTSAFVASRYGDEKLFFQHNTH